MMNGMPLGNVVTDLEIDDSPYVLTAGSYGRGAWQISLISAPLSVTASEDLAACAGAGQSVGVEAQGGLAPYTYSWSVVSGPDTSSGQFDSTSSSQPMFTPSATGQYELQCSVQDSGSNSINATIEITAFDQASYQASQLEGWSDTAGSPGWLSFLDPNGNDVIELLDLVMEMTDPQCK